MKLKKIASLMLAGIMAVSMLAACGEGIKDDNDENTDEIVTPVDDSLAVAVNDILSTAVKNTLPITANAELEAALNNVSGKISTTFLADSVNKFIVNSDAEDFRHLMGLADDASLTTSNGNYVADPVRFGATGAWKYFSVVDSAKTTLDLIVYDGELTEEGLAEHVADDLKALANEHRMPGEGTVNYGRQGMKDFDYSYAANIASVKIDNLRGDNSYYVVALKVTQTPTEVVNAQ